MEYQVLSQEEQDDIIVSFLLSQERDEFCHQLNLERYKQMLTVLPEGAWKSQVTKLRDETSKRLEEVKSISAATIAQLPPAERIETAKQRLKAKEAARAV